MELTVNQTQTGGTMTYLDALGLFSRARDKTAGKLLRRNTRLVRTVDGFGVKLHNTIVVEILPNGNYVLNTGGWETVTTKARINYYSPATVFQRKFKWFISNNLPFYDSITVDSDGKVVDFLADTAKV